MNKNEKNSGKINKNYEKINKNVKNLIKIRIKIWNIF